MLNNKKYIYSSAKYNLVLTWAIAIILSLFSYPVITVGFGKADNTGVIILLMLFTLLATLFLYFAIRDIFSLSVHGRTALLKKQISTIPIRDARWCKRQRQHFRWSNIKPTPIATPLSIKL